MNLKPQTPQELIFEISMLSAMLALCAELLGKTTAMLEDLENTNEETDLIQRVKKTMDNLPMEAHKLSEKISLLHEITQTFKQSVVITTDDFTECHYCYTIWPKNDSSKHLSHCPLFKYEELEKMK